MSATTAPRGRLNIPAAFQTMPSKPDSLNGRKPVGPVNPSENGRGSTLPKQISLPATNGNSSPRVKAEGQRSHSPREPRRSITERKPSDVKTLPAHTKIHIGNGTGDRPSPRRNGVPSSGPTTSLSDKGPRPSLVEAMNSASIAAVQNMPKSKRLPRSGKNNSLKKLYNLSQYSADHPDNPIIPQNRLPSIPDGDKTPRAGAIKTTIILPPPDENSSPNRGEHKRNPSALSIDSDKTGGVSETEQTEMDSDEEKENEEYISSRSDLSNAYRDGGSINRLHSKLANLPKSKSSSRIHMSAKELTSMMSQASAAAQRPDVKTTPPAKSSARATVNSNMKFAIAIDTSPDEKVQAAVWGDLQPSSPKLEKELAALKSSGSSTGSLKRTSMAATPASIPNPTGSTPAKVTPSASRESVATPWEVDGVSGLRLPPSSSRESIPEHTKTGCCVVL